jgi:hypothetical protein
MKFLGFLLILAIIIAPVALYRNAKYNSERHVKLVVTTLPDRSVQYNANGEKNSYANLVYTDQGTFQNTDSYFPLKRNSSDLYGKLHEKGKYDCVVAGWRLPIFSTYPSLVRCAEIKA